MNTVNDIGKIQQAIAFAIRVHEVDQKQKRKGKDMAYITHPLTVGLLLANSGAETDLVCAGILHDAIEDSAPEYKVSRETLTEKFGEHVAALVGDVTEDDRTLAWEDRKAAALAHIAEASEDAAWLKSADLLSNVTEILADYDEVGDKLFDRFGAPKTQVVAHYIAAIEAVLKRWPENPLAGDLRGVVGKLRLVG